MLSLSILLCYSLILLQKILVIDSDVAYVGGLDLCYCRWDTQAHELIDDCRAPSSPGWHYDVLTRRLMLPDLHQRWPGQDYCNPRFKQYETVEIPFKDVIDRATVPRMPWHDIHLCLGTPFALCPLSRPNPFRFAPCDR